MIGNRDTLRSRPDALDATREIMERIEGRRQADAYCRVTANIEGASEEAVAARVLERPEAAGLQGPTVARVYTSGAGSWYAVTMFVERHNLSTVVDYLRAIGGASVTVSQADYVFGQESAAYRELLANLGLS